MVASMFAKNCALRVHVQQGVQSVTLLTKLEIAAVEANEPDLVDASVAGIARMIGIED